MKGLEYNLCDVARELARKYSTMSHNDLDILRNILVPMKFNKGDLVLAEGQICRNIYYIDKGLVRQFYLKKGKEVTEHLAVEGNIVMCIESLFRDEKTRLQVEALENTVIYALPKVRLEEVALHNQNIQILYRKILEESLIQSQVHADLVRFETAKDRYMKLCKLQPQVVARTPLIYVASYLQMTPETLSRVRSMALLD